MGTNGLKYFLIFLWLSCHNYYHGHYNHLQSLINHKTFTLITSLKNIWERVQGSLQKSDHYSPIYQKISGYYLEKCNLHIILLLDCFLFLSFISKFTSRLFMFTYGVSCFCSQPARWQRVKFKKQLRN